VLVATFWRKYSAELFSGVLFKFDSRSACVVPDAGRAPAAVPN
jgi:hypothetical protein